MLHGDGGACVEHVIDQFLQHHRADFVGLAAGFLRKGVGIKEQAPVGGLVNDRCGLPAFAPQPLPLGGGILLSDRLTRFSGVRCHALGVVVT